MHGVCRGSSVQNAVFRHQERCGQGEVFPFHGAEGGVRGCEAGGRRGEDGDKHPFRDRNNYSNLAVFEKAFARENVSKKLEALKKAEPRLVKCIIRGKEAVCPIVPLGVLKGEDGMVLNLSLASYEKIDFKAQKEGRFQKKRDPNDIKFVYGVIFEISDPVSKKKLASPVKWEQTETISAWIDALRKEVKQ